MIRTLAKATAIATVMTTTLVALLASPAHAQKISDLSTEEAAPSVDPTVTKIGDWSLLCESDDSSACAMTQLGRDTEGFPAIEFVVRKVEEEEAKIEGIKIVAVADIITPLGVLLEFGLRLKIDGEEERGALFRICKKQGCLVREPLSEDVIASLKKGNKAIVTVAAEGAGAIDIEISLAGFTKAYDSL